MKNPTIEELVSCGFYVTCSYACLFGVTTNMYRYHGKDNKKLEVILYSNKFFIIKCTKDNYELIRNSLDESGAKDIRIEDIEMILRMHGMEIDEHSKGKFHIKFNPENGIEILNKLFMNLNNISDK